ncbi:MAG: DUF418 domain-containing protein [Pedobacter sp.]|uniref:DUF418 domain-containing protein n=1 Tax=Pedobacter sp. TaxID=1411316 RepID=UPI003393D6EA
MEMGIFEVAPARTYYSRSISGIRMVWSTVWLRYFWIGPFDWLLHNLTWSKVQPIKKQVQQNEIL